MAGSEDDTLYGSRTLEGRSSLVCTNNTCLRSYFVPPSLPPALLTIVLGDTRVCVSHPSYMKRRYTLLKNNKGHSTSSQSVYGLGLDSDTLRSTHPLPGLTFQTTRTRKTNLLLVEAAFYLITPVLTCSLRYVISTRLGISFSCAPYLNHPGAYLSASSLS